MLKSKGMHMAHDIKYHNRGKQFEDILQPDLVGLRVTGSRIGRIVTSARLRRVVTKGADLGSSV
jgi:hypothetical protein